MHIKIHSLNKHTVRSNQGQLVSSELQQHVRRTHAHIEKNCPTHNRHQMLKALLSPRVTRATYTKMVYIKISELMCSSNPIAHTELCVQPTHTQLCYVRPTHSHIALLCSSNPLAHSSVMFVQPTRT